MPDDAQEQRFRELSLRSTPQIPDHELLKRIGGGSYGEVWLARSVMGSYRAVKVVHRKTFDHDRPYDREFEGIQKFEPISRLHPSQLQVLHVGRNDVAGCFYYVMELADDASRGKRDGDVSPGAESPIDPSTYVAHTLKQELNERGQLPVDECVEIGLVLTTALQRLHDHGLVHRDVKPSNIIFVNRVPKLADIGLIASMDGTMSYVGTSGFLPPEGPGSPQGDLYSLGKVLYEACMGRDRQEFPRLPANLERYADREQLLELNAVIVKACHTDARQRYQSASEMAADLTRLQSGKSIRNSWAMALRWTMARRFGLAMSVFIVLLILFRSSALRRSVAKDDLNSLAILPFDVSSQNQVDRYLGESLPGELIRTITKISALKVASPNSSFTFTNQPQDARSIGSKLRARALCKGIIKKSSDRLQVEIALINAASGTELWAKTYQCEMKDLAAIQTEMAQRVIGALTARSNAEQPPRIINPRTDNPEAYRLYLQGAYFLHRWSEGNIDPAIQFLEKAVALDPKFAPGQADLAQAYVQKAFSFDPQQHWQAKASAAIATALALDPNCAEAFLARGKFLWSPWSRFQHESAVKDLRRAVALDPNLAEAYQHLALVYVHLGLFERAREASRRALDVDPLNLGALYREGVADLYEGRYGEALAIFERVPPSRETALLTMQAATALFYLGRTNEAKARIDTLLSQKPNDPLVLSMKALLFAATGESDEAAKSIREASEREAEYFGHYHHVSYNIACAYALLRKNPLAITWLKKSAEEGYPCYPRFDRDRNLDNLRADAPFRAFMDEQRQQFEKFQKTL